MLEVRGSWELCWLMVVLYLLKCREPSCLSQAWALVLSLSKDGRELQCEGRGLPQSSRMPRAGRGDMEQHSRAVGHGSGG